MRTAPVWFDRFPQSRRPTYPRLKGERTSRVVIVGGGLTGAACALSFALAGIQTVLLEAERVGSGVTGGASGVIREGLSGSFQQSVVAGGLRSARTMWSGFRRAGLDFAAALKRHAVACDLREAELITFARPDPDAVRLLKRELEARKGAGIPGAWMTAALVGREARFESGGAIRTRGFTLDPYKACLGCLRAAAARGAEVFEGSPVRRLRARKDHVEAVTDGGTVRADAVVVATGSPLADLRPLRRHLRAQHVYGVVTDPLPAAVRRELGARAAIIEPFDEPGRTVRSLRDDRLLVHGGQQPPVTARARARALTQRTGQLMYETLLLYPVISGLRPAAAWDALEHDTADGLPLMGPHRRFPHHFFAFSSARHGAGAAWLAARAALRYVQGAPAREDAPFGFGRIV